MISVIFFLLHFPVSQHSEQNQLALSFFPGWQVVITCEGLGNGTAIIKPCVELPEKNLWVFKKTLGAEGEKKNNSILPLKFSHSYFESKGRDFEKKKKRLYILSTVAFLFQGLLHLFIYFLFLVPNITLVLWGTYQGLFSKDAQDQKINKSKAKPNLVQI